MDECVFDPLNNTKLKPRVQVLSQFFCGITETYINSDFLGSSLFTDYLDSLSRVTANYVRAGKMEALNSFLFSVFWLFKERLNSISYIDVSNVLSKGISLSASLIAKLEKMERKDDLRETLFVASSYFTEWLIKYPRAFTRLEIEDLVYMIGKDDSLFLGQVIISLASVEAELEKIEEIENAFVYERSFARFVRIKTKIVESLNKNRWLVFVDAGSLKVMDVDARTYGGIQLQGILQESEVEILQSFIERNLT